MILSNTIDDLLSLFDEKLQLKIEQYRKALLEKVHEWTHVVSSMVQENLLTMTDRKQHALWIRGNHPEISQVYFNALDGKLDLIGYILKHTSSSTKINEVKKLLDLPDWYSFKG